jgi:hypothetical protein
MENLGWKTLEHRRDINKALLMFIVVNNAAPMYLVSQFSKRDEVDDHDVCGSKFNLTIPKPNTNFMKSSLAYSGAVVWNSLDEATKTCDSLSTFKNRINSNM